MAGPEPVPPLLGFPVDGRVHVVDTATGRVLQNVEPGRDERLVRGRRPGAPDRRPLPGRDLLLRRLRRATRRPGRRCGGGPGVNLRTADSAGCVQREDPQGGRNVLIGVGPDGREAVIDGYDGRLLWVGAAGEKLLAVDDRYAVVRSADKRSVVARELGTDRVRWTRSGRCQGRRGAHPVRGGARRREAVPAGRRGAAQRPGAGRACGPPRTPSPSDPSGMIIGEGREIGYVRWGATGGRPPPGDGDDGRPGPGGTGPGQGNDGDCGPKGELCPDPDGGKDG